MRVGEGVFHLSSFLSYWTWFDSFGLLWCCSSGSSISLFGLGTLLVSGILGVEILQGMAFSPLRWMCLKWYVFHLVVAWFLMHASVIVAPGWLALVWFGPPYDRLCGVHMIISTSNRTFTILCPLGCLLLPCYAESCRKECCLVHVLAKFDSELIHTYTKYWVR